ncbi:MAG: hypothetical protein PSY14_15985 [bacterium]|nr:hypothetical protein [bacterium]
MAVKNYANNETLPVSANAQKNFDDGVAKIRATMKSYGFAAEAVNSIEFNLTRHTLAITLDEARSGAFHTFADGNPFYAINIKSPGSMLDIGDSSKPTKMTVEQQAAMITFEIGINLIGRVEKAIEVKFGIPADERAGGVSMSMSPDFETTTRRDPSLFLDALNDLVDMRLGMLTPKVATTASSPTKPSANTP